MLSTILQKFSYKTTLPPKNSVPPGHKEKDQPVNQWQEFLQVKALANDLALSLDKIINLEAPSAIVSNNDVYVEARKALERYKAYEPCCDADQWWPPREQWLPADKMLYLHEEALALLLCMDLIYASRAFPPDDTDKETIGLYVGCNDVFYWGCADGEDLPLIGYGEQTVNNPFWDLYERVRKIGSDGAIQWCCLRRQMRPQKPMINYLKSAGHWTEELEALPERDQ